MNPQRFALIIVADEHIQNAVVSGLIARGVDTVRSIDIAELGEGASDEGILEWATANHRCVLTLDSDFAVLHAEWTGTGRNHAGIIYGSAKRYQTNIGAVVTFVIDIANIVGDMEDIANQLLEIQ